jgi:hypothetical protein
LLLFSSLKFLKNAKKKGKLLCYHTPHKAEKERVMLTVGRAILDYSGEVATPTTDITTFKSIINSNLSPEDAEIMMMYIKNHYLGTPLPMYEYKWLHLSIISDDIIAKYKLKAI